MRHPEPRIPWEPIRNLLVAVSGRRWYEDVPMCLRSNWGSDTDGTLTDELAAEMVGCGPKMISRYRRNGVPVSHFDRVCVALGHHPDEVLPGWDA